MSKVIPVVPLPPVGAHKKKPSGGLLPFASLLCCVHSTSSSDQRLSSVTFAKADASPTSDIGDAGWEEGTAKEQADIQHRPRSQGAGKGCPKVLWSLGALPSLPSLALQVLSFPPLSPSWGMRNVVLLRVVSGNKGKALGRYADTACCLNCWKSYHLWM